VVRGKGSRLLSALDDSERSELLGALLRRHPELREDAERLARERLAGPDPEGLAGEVESALQGLDPGLLAGRAGRVPGRGYVDVGEAAAELLEETIEPYLDDLRRRVRLGLPEAAADIGHGLLLGLARVSAPAPGSVLAYAGEDAVGELAEEVRALLRKHGLPVPDLPEPGSGRW
jgi:hypothetical protein